MAGRKVKVEGGDLQALQEVGSNWGNIMILSININQQAVALDQFLSYSIRCFQFQYELNPMLEARKRML